MGKRTGSPQRDTKSSEEPPKAPDESKDEGPVVLSVDDWCRRVFPSTRRRPIHPELDVHNAAAARHRWALCAHHTGAPMQVTLEDYRLALEAGQRTKADEDAGKGPRVHEPALFQLQTGSGDA